MWMDWIEMLSWVVVGLVLASLHTWLPRERTGSPSSVYAGACIGAIIGALVIGALRLARLEAGGYSFVRLSGAFVGGELGVLATWRPPHYRRPRTT
jgi:hypothetical protein